MELYNIITKVKDIETGKLCSAVIRELSLEEEDQYMSLQQNIVDSLQDKNIFVSMTREEYKKYLGIFRAVSLGLFIENKLQGAWFTVSYGNNEGNLAKDIGLKEEEAHRNCNYETAILSPRFRGQGLNSMIAKIMSKALTEKGFEYISATVEPTNYGSMGSILKDGYVVIKRKQKYGGLDRYIFVKKLTEPIFLEERFIKVDCKEKEKISDLLFKGYVGVEIIKGTGITRMKLHKSTSKI